MRLVHGRHGGKERFLTSPRRERSRLGRNDLAPAIEEPLPSLLIQRHHQRRPQRNGLDHPASARGDGFAGPFALGARDHRAQRRLPRRDRLAGRRQRDFVAPAAREYPGEESGDAYLTAGGMSPKTSVGRIENMMTSKTALQPVRSIVIVSSDNAMSTTPMR